MPAWCFIVSRATGDEKWILHGMVPTFRKHCLTVNNIHWLSLITPYNWKFEHTHFAKLLLVESCLSSVIDIFRDSTV